MLLAILAPYKTFHSNKKHSRRRRRQAGLAVNRARFSHKPSIAHCGSKLILMPYLEYKERDM